MVYDGALEIHTQFGFYVLFPLQSASSTVDVPHEFFPELDMKC